jgi:acyl carrier protein
VYVLDAEMAAVAIGVVGEVYIGGEGLARGYVNRAEMTAERFVPHPYSERGGERLYRTGDEGRVLENGEIEYLGRADQQVKVRGYRIELGEVEARLGKHPSVREAVVVARADTDEEGGGKRLVAYVVASEGAEIRSSEIRSYMGEELPEYMIPSLFVELEELPLTANGKVDRARLPEPDRSRVELDAELVLPRTPAEEVVAEVWARVLGLDQIGVRDNFFQLGGHSLLTTQMVSRLRDIFRVEIPLRSVFQSPTVEGVVNVIAEIWGEREIVEEIARTFKEVEQLSESEVETTLYAQE